MDRAELQPLCYPVEPLGFDGWQRSLVLAFGGRPADLPGVRFHTDPLLPSVAIVLVGPVDAAEVGAVLDELADPAIPVADFAANRGARRDFVGDALDAGSFAAACTRFAPIWRRLAELPFRARREQRAELTVLRLAYSRAAPIEASFAPDTAAAIDYPLLGRSAATQQRLERLASLDLLRRRHFIRTNACGRCGSARLLAYEACPGCGSSDLADERIVHHYRCGCQEPESHFIRGRQLLCPKCNRELRHLGMDYGRPGTIVHCRSCGATNAEPDPCFTCLDCVATAPADQAPATDWFHYDLTDEGVRALRDGRLPDGDLDATAPGQVRTCSEQEFRMLAGAAARSAQRFGRPFCTVQLACAGIATLRGSYGAARTEAAFEDAVRLVMEALPDSVFVATTAGAGLLIGLPETTAAEANDIAERLCATVAAGADLALDFAATVREVNAAAAMAEPV
jgi:ribosomal protein S27E